MPSARQCRRLRHQHGEQRSPLPIAIQPHTAAVPAAAAAACRAKSHCPEERPLPSFVAAHFWCSLRCNRARLRRRRGRDCCSQRLPALRHSPCVQRRLLPPRRPALAQRSLSLSRRSSRVRTPCPRAVADRSICISCPSCACTANVIQLVDGVQGGVRPDARRARRSSCSWSPPSAPCAQGGRRITAMS